MSEPRVRRRLAAILAADVVGYSRLIGEDEDATLAELKIRWKEIVAPLVSKHRGRIFKVAGDGLFAVFDSAVEAVECAIALQQAMEAANAGERPNRQILLRIGINLGEVVVEGGDLYGDGVNIAARLEGIAKAGAVVISEAVFELVKRRTNFAFVDIGPQLLKNIAQPIRAYSNNTVSFTSGPATGQPIKKPSVAVLPFNNMSADPDQEYFADGITEDITTELSRFRALTVIARNSSFTFKGRSANISEVGRALGASYVVEGSVRKVGTRVRITAQLIDAATGAHIWAERFDRDLQQIFAVQDEVTERLVWALTGKISAAEIGRAKQRRLESFEAYDLVLRAEDYMNRYSSSDANAAVGFLQEAAQLAPNSGWVLSWLARAYLEAGVTAYDLKMFDLAVETADQALTLSDPEDWTDAIVAYVLGWRRQYEAAEVRVRKAWARNPNDSITALIRIIILLWSGQVEQSRSIAEHAVRLDPVNPTWFYEYQSYAEYLTGNYDRSLQAFRKLMPVRFYRAYAYFAACLGQLGMTDEAKLAWSQCLQLRPGFTVEEFDGGAPYAKPQRDQWLDGLRKAGIVGETNSDSVT
jgi:adenylate cyclase